METSLLVAARDEYTSQLQDILAENVYEGMKKVWEEAKITQNRNVLRVFQEKLCSIPQWNQEVINVYYKKILTSNQITAEYLDKILEAVFLSNVKILSVIKIHGKKQTINVPVPDTKNFIHRVFIETARQFYIDPHLVDDREYGSNSSAEIQRNIKRSIKIIIESIDKTIRAMIPMEEILNKYLESQEEEVNIEKEDSSDDGDFPQQQQEDVPRSPSPPEPYHHDNDQQHNAHDNGNGQETFEETFMDQPPPQPQAREHQPQVQEQIFQQPQPQDQPLHIDLKNNTNNQENFFSDSD